MITWVFMTAVFSLLMAFSLISRVIQGLVTARGKEAGTEEHLFKIAQREEGRLKQEISRLIKEMDDLKEKKNNSEVVFAT